MLRTRWASLALAGGLLVLTCCSTTGCSMPGMNGGGFLSRLFPNCRPGCECEDICLSTPGCATGACPGGLPQAGPTIIQGPAMFPPNPTPIINGGTMPPAIGSRPNPLPPVVSAPQATPVPAGP